MWKPNRLFVSVIGLVLWTVIAAVALGAIEIPRTGQLLSFFPGDDGDLQEGVAWPVPRFTNNGDGTVTNHLTGLMWTQNANLAGPGTWADALQFVADMNAGAHDNFGYTDWRLPNIVEIRALVDHSTANPPLAAGHPFVGVQNFFRYYWSSTTRAGFPSHAWALFVWNGGITVWDKAVDFPPHFDSTFLWPVRAGQTGVVSLPQTGQGVSYAATDDGDLQEGVVWPVPRFTDNGDGTVRDNLTNFVWTQDANLAGTNTTWHEALEFVAAMNTGLHANFGHTDWRLPNVNELQSLLNFGAQSPALSAGHPFSNLQLNFYWSSTTDARSAGAAWLIHFADGTIGTGTKAGAPLGQGVWPVRGPVLQAGTCPLSQGFWKNHPGAWPVTSLTLGSLSYTQAQLLAILNTPVRRDASLNLAHQLIAAKLNIANGSDPGPVSSTVAAADALLGGSVVPQNITSRSATGQAMIAAKDVLDSYNRGDLTPSCVP